MVIIKDIVKYAIRFRKAFEFPYFRRKSKIKFTFAIIPIRRVIWILPNNSTGWAYKKILNSRNIYNFTDCIIAAFCILKMTRL